MPHIMTRQRARIAGLLLILMAVFSACSEDAQPTPDTGQVSAPPSLSENAPAAEAVITLTPVQVQELNIQTVTAARDNFSYPVSVPGIVMPAPDHISLISAPINGLVVAIHAHEGEKVRKGEVLLEIESLEFANLVAEYLQAEAEAKYQKSRLERMKLLGEKKITPQREIERAESDFTRANAVVQGTYSRLLAVGVSEQQIERWQSGQERHSHLKITAPIDGVITEHLVDMGQAVNAYQKLGAIVDTRKVLVKGFVSPEDGAILNPGDRVDISLREYPEKRIPAASGTIVPTLDEINKSITVNVLVNTSDQWPRPGQNVRLTISARTPAPVISIPLQAVQYEGDQAAVFLQLDPQRYRKHFIQISKIAGEMVIVESGLNGGEAVAVTQVFSLKALSKYEEFAEE